MWSLRRGGLQDARATGAQVLVDCLLAQGVTTAFGVPGRELSRGARRAARRAATASGSSPDRHEGGAAFMAEA